MANTDVRRVSKSNPDIVILIADDEPIIRDLVRTIVQAEGYSLLVAASGKEALALSRAYPDDIDVVVTDFTMPEMNGVMLANQLIDERPKIRVLVISGSPADEISIDTHGFPFLKKPFMPQVLKDKLQEVLDGPPAKECRQA